MKTNNGILINNVPCKMCIECRNMRREEFTQRLLHEWQTQGFIGSFITLTYRDEDLPILLPLGSAVVGHWFGSTPPAFGSTLSRKDASQFTDKLGKRIRRKYGHGIKYILAAEYGDEGHRPHYHGIIIGLPGSERKMLLECWNKGMVSIDPISHADIRYTLKYIDKQIFGANDLYFNYGDFEPPFAHFSKGLGVDWIEKNIDKFDRFGKIKFNDSGKSYTLNPYYRDKYMFQKKPHLVDNKYADSVKKFAKYSDMNLETAYNKRQKIIETSLQRKALSHNESMYNVDTIEKINAISY